MTRAGSTRRNSSPVGLGAQWIETRLAQCDQDACACKGFAQRACPSGEYRQFAATVIGFWSANTGINDGPTRTAFEKVKVDVIKAHRERHAKPIDGWCNLDQFARLGRFAKRVGNHRALGKSTNRDST